MLLALFAFLGLSTAREGYCADGAPELRAAWHAWQAGDFAEARKLASSLSGQEHNDEALQLLTLTAIIRGEYAEARAAYRQIGPRYGRLPELDVPMLWAHIHQGDLAAAREFAERRGLLDDRVIAGRLRLAIEHPLRIELSGVAELPFTDDKLTPFMPGVAARLNGQVTVARLDTGGEFLHLTPAQARAFGVESVVCERAFFGLIEGGICYGMAETLEIGPVRLSNVPVAILDGLPAEQVAASFGVELGPIIGTNILQRFLTTIDGPRGRLILSRRGDAGARAGHLSRIEKAAKVRHETSFGLWDSHLMIAQGRIGAVRPVNFFMDSGLVVANPEQGQAALLASESVLGSWRAQMPEAGHFAVLPGALGIGGASLERMTVFPVTDGKWQEQFGDWGGVKVEALASWGFLKHFAWTIDFDRHVYLFDER
jgi:hypothetical protein